MSTEIAETGALTARQREVLDAALAQLVEAGDRLTMTAVAREASCSKETLYNWFGDRDGLLTAVVQWQASKVRAPVLDSEKVTQASLSVGLAQFARDWLTVLTSETSVALNRLAMAHAGHEKSGLGAIVLENGRRAMGRRLRPLLEAGRAAGLLAFADVEEAFRVFFGLVIRDVQIRALLGDRLEMTTDGIARDAEVAVRQFFALYGVNP